MTYVSETLEQRQRRIRTGRIVATIAVTWWIVSVGGIIYVVSAS